MKIAWWIVQALCRTFEHLPSHSIQLVLNSVGHLGTGIVMQRDGAISEFIRTCGIDLGMQLWKHLALNLFINFVITLKSSNRHLLMPKNAFNIAFLTGACYLNLFGWGELRCLLCMPAGFHVRTEQWRRVWLPTTVCHRNTSPSVWYCCKCSSDSCNFPCMCLPVDRGRTGSPSWNIRDVVWLYAQCWCSYSVWLIGNKWSDICPCTQHSQLMQCSPD